MKEVYHSNIEKYVAKRKELITKHILHDMIHAKHTDTRTCHRHVYTHLNMHRKSGKQAQKPITCGYYLGNGTEKAGWAGSF